MVISSCDLLREQPVALLRLELGGRHALRAQVAEVDVALEAAVDVEALHALDRRAHFLVRDGEAEPLRLLLEKRGVDDLVERTVLEVERLDELRGQALAVELTVELFELLRGAAYVLRRDALAVHRGGVEAVAAGERADAPEDEDRDDDPKENLDRRPLRMTTHVVEHEDSVPKTG